MLSESRQQRQLSRRRCRPTPGVCAVRDQQLEAGKAKEWGAVPRCQGGAPFFIDTNKSFFYFCLGSFVPLELRLCLDREKRGTGKKMVHSPNGIMADRAVGPRAADETRSGPVASHGRSGVSFFMPCGGYSDSCHLFRSAPPSLFPTQNPAPRYYPLLTPYYVSVLIL